MDRLKLYTHSLKETQSFGEKIGRNISSNSVILLDGDLGAGKTSLTQGIAKGLDIKRNVTSPTFNILKIYSGRMPLYHIDAYRLEGVTQDLGFEEFLDDDGLTVIEWSEFIPELIPDEYLKINIHLLSDEDREFECIAYGNKYEKLLEDIA